jgi:stress-induced morphogen
MSLSRHRLCSSAIHQTDADTRTTGGCGQMFEAIIVSAQFEKKTSLARHRLVNNTLKAEIAAIHAWTPKCMTPAEWEKKKGSLQA